jgi:hypothetical protein
MCRLVYREIVFRQRLSQYRCLPERQRKSFSGDRVD